MSDHDTTTDTDTDAEEEFDREAHALTVLDGMDAQALHKVTGLGTESLGTHATDVVKYVAREVRAAYAKHVVDLRNAGRIADEIGENTAIGDESRILAQAATLVFYLAPLRFGESPDEVQAGRRIGDALRDALRVAATAGAQQLITHVEEEVDAAEGEWEDARDAGTATEDGEGVGQDTAGRG